MTEAERLAQGLDKEQIDTVRRDMLNHEAASLLRAQAAEIERLKVAMNQWLDKTEWVQETVQPQELGMHRADVLRKRIDALRAELEAIKKQEPDSTCSDTLRIQGKAYPRTCKKCGLGPCIGKRIDAPKQEQLYVQELADDATLLNYLLTVGESQALNIHDVYSDWDGDGDFKEFCMAAMKEQANG